MAEKTRAQRGICTAVVAANNRIRNGFGRLVLEAEGRCGSLLAGAMPGQFVQVDLSQAPPPPPDRIPEELRETAQKQILLRRPFSFSDITAAAGVTTVEMIYHIKGPSTVRMMNLKAGNQLSLIGPLGNGFRFPENMRLALLVSGGMGAPPVLHLARYLRRNFPQVQIQAFCGARTFDHLPFDFAGQQPQEFENLEIPAEVTTDDGSFGRKGFVTERLSDWLAANNPDPSAAVIYACGPEPMLAVCAGIAAKAGMLCQVSMERMMACGIGLCQSCAIEVRQEGSSETVYKLCCKDGPVFDSRNIVFNK